MLDFDIRHYRARVRPLGLKAFRVVYKESDLQVLASRDLAQQTLAILRKIRTPLENYILSHPLFLKSLKPISVEPTAPDIVKIMARAGRLAGTGPMAAVAGAIAQEVGRSLLLAGFTKEVVVENGGDIFLALKREATVALWAGDSPLSGKIGLRISPEIMPLGVCTSSASVGHSLSLGCADALCVLAPCAAFADAMATALGNLVKGRRSWDKILKIVKSMPQVQGVVCVLGEELFAWGPAVRLVPLTSTT